MRIEWTEPNQRICGMARNISYYRIGVFLQYVFALPALGFNYNHNLKDFFAKTFNNVGFDLREKIIAIIKSEFSISL